MNPNKVDLGRLILILVTRNIALSNSMYSVLLEAEGKFLTIGSEWIGSLVRYEERSICFSKLFASKDPFYTNQKSAGNNKDECEYFANGIINDDRIYFQNYVFDSTLEIEFDFANIELEFVQKKAEKKMLVSSNPFFAFHDDVFPAFAKNAVSQKRFPRSNPLFTTLIPDDFFASLEEFEHFSTFEMKFNGTENLKFKVNLQVKINL